MIESVRLVNFKNFRDATLTLGPLTVIVGTNASGKSNIRDAFRFIHGMARGYTVAEIIGEKYVEGGVLQWRGIRGGTRETAFYGSSSFQLETKVVLPKNDPEITACDATGDWWATHRIKVSLSDLESGPRSVQESLYDKCGMNFDSHATVDPPAQEAREYLFVGMPRDEQSRKQGKRQRFLSSSPVVSQFLKRMVKTRYRKPAKCFLTNLQSMRFLDLSPAAMRMPSIPGQTILGDQGENLSSVLQAICADNSIRTAMSEWIRELTPVDVVDFEFVPDQTGRILVTLVESNGQRTSAYSASDGTLRFLAIIAALLGPDSAKFYFLEEIDNGIHPTRLYLLLQLIEQQTKHGDVQIVTTTHSPQLLGMLSREAREHASVVYRLEGETEGRIKRIVDIPEARKVLESQNLSRLHESGWLENAVSFATTLEETE